MAHLKNGNSRAPSSRQATPSCRMRRSNNGEGCRSAGSLLEGALVGVDANAPPVKPWCNDGLCKVRIGFVGVDRSPLPIRCNRHAGSAYRSTIARRVGEPNGRGIREIARRRITPCRGDDLIAQILFSRRRLGRKPCRQSYSQSHRADYMQAVHLCTLPRRRPSAIKYVRMVIEGPSLVVSRQLYRHAGLEPHPASSGYNVKRDPGSSPG
jgi:hypothetical protein